MSSNTPFKTVTRAQLVRALKDADFELPHAEPSQLPAPFVLAQGDVALEEIKAPRGTLVVIGNLTLGQDLDARRVSGLAHIVVTGDLQLRHAYFDAFLVVGGTLRGDTLVADSTWDGGLFAGAIEADTLVLKDCALEFLGKKKLSVKRLADFEKPRSAKKAVPELFPAKSDDDVDAYAFFVGLPR